MCLARSQRKSLVLLVLPLFVGCFGKSGSDGASNGGCALPAVVVTNAAASPVTFHWSTTDLAGLNSTETIGAGRQDAQLAVLSGAATYSYTATRNSDSASVGSGTFQITCGGPAVSVVLSDPAAPLGTYPAPHGSLPTVTTYGGATAVTLTHPKLYAITFANEDATWRTNIDTFVSDLVGMPFMSTMAEYGFVSATAPTPIHLAQSATASMTFYGSIYSILDTAFSTSDARFGTPDPQNLYIFYFPVGTTIDSANCSNAQASHYYYYSSGGVAMPVALVPRCGGAGATLADITYGTSHEVVEAITDPIPDSGSGYFTIDNAHSIWGVMLNGNTELGDMCQGLNSPGSFNDSVHSYFMNRTWSNAAAAAGHFPCLTGGTATPMRMAVPVMTETVKFNNTTLTNGVYIPVGGTRTIELQLFSDQAVANWNVTVSEVGGTGHLSFTQSATSGNNGTVILLTIKVLSKNPTYGAEVFRVVSDSTTSLGTVGYYGVVGN